MERCFLVAQAIATPLEKKMCRLVEWATSKDASDVPSTSTLGAQFRVGRTL